MAATRTETRTGRSGWVGLAIVLMLTGGAAVIWFGDRSPWKGTSGWQNRTGMETITERLVGDIQQDLSGGIDRSQSVVSASDFVVYVYGEPALFFHLRAAGVVAGPVSHLEWADPSARSLEVPLYLAVGPHALRSPEFAEDWTRHKDRFRRLSEFEYRPSNLVALNNYPPDRLTGEIRRPLESVRLYRLKPAQPLP